MRFHFDCYKVISLGNLAEMFDNIQHVDDDMVLSTTMLYEIATDVCDVTVDGNHCGTMVGLMWFLEQLMDAGATEYAEENGNYANDDWQRTWAEIYHYAIPLDKAEMRYVLITD